MDGHGIVHALTGSSSAEEHTNSLTKYKAGSLPRNTELSTVLTMRMTYYNQHQIPMQLSSTPTPFLPILPSWQSDGKLFMSLLIYALAQMFFLLSEERLTFNQSLVPMLKA